ncbi:hypothetical protein ACJ41O_014723 [Fusarium nematophilum]
MTQPNYFAINGYFASETEALSLAAQRDRSARSLDTLEIDLEETHKASGLGALIRASMIPSNGKVEPSHVFLPRDALEQALTEERVEEEFSNAGCKLVKEDSSSAQVPKLVNFNQLGKRKEILAILALVEKLEAIVDFMDEGVDDSHLPFERALGEDDPGRMGLKRKDTGGGLHAIQLFKKWRDRDVEAFENQQWRVHVPVFSTTGSEGAKPPHYELGYGTILPYVSTENVGRGGFSAVDKVEIHPSHLDGLCDKGNTQRYAVKKLIYSDEAAFWEEVSSLSRFSGKDHPHLIRLLWTFKLNEDYHLVFPCADGNLMDLWRRHTTPLAQRRDHSVAIWFARQCLGIIEGLCMIHQDDNHHPPDGERKRHGRHGDLKPENILWFDNFDKKREGYSLGALKISDFGLTKFHSTMSRFRINIHTGRVGGSPTYRAPECDVTEEVSQSYDIWSLACVLLEFVAWYLKGWKEVNDFSQKRKDEHSNPDLKEDTFFNYFQVMKDGKSYTGAQAKLSVAKEFRELYEHENGSDFTIELLDYIQKDLLRMHHDLRAECTKIHNKFIGFYDSCQKDRAYCLDRVKTPPSQRDTELSVLEPSIIGQKLDNDKSRGVQSPSQDDLAPWLAQSRRGSGSQSPARRLHSNPRKLSQDHTVIKEEPET